MLGLKTVAAAPLLFSMIGLFGSGCMAPGGRPWPRKKRRESLSFNAGYKTCPYSLSTQRTHYLVLSLSKYTVPVRASTSSWSECFCLPPQGDTAVCTKSWSDVGHSRACSISSRSNKNECQTNLGCIMLLIPFILLLCLFFQFRLSCFCASALQIDLIMSQLLPILTSALVARFTERLRHMHSRRHS